MREVPLWSLCTCNDDTLPEDTDPDLQIKYIDISNVDSVNGISGFSSYNFSESPSRARRLAKVGDIIVSTVRTYLQAIALVDQKHADCVFSTGFAVLRPKDPRQSLAIYFALKSKIVTDRINIQSKGVAYPSITSTELMHIKVQLQKNVERLVKAASSINDIIYKKEKLIKALFEYRQSLITRTVTKGLSPNVPMKDSKIPWIGEIPFHWNLIRLRFISKITTGDSDSQDAEESGKYPFYVRSPKVERSSHFTFDREEILLAGDGAGAGRVFHLARGKHAVHQRVYVLYDFQYVIPEFLIESLRVLFPQRMEFGSAQSTVPSIRLPMLQDFIVPVPPIKEQELIVRNIQRNVQKIKEIVDSFEITQELLQEYKETLLMAVIASESNHA